MAYRRSNEIYFTIASPTHAREMLEKALRTLGYSEPITIFENSNYTFYQATLLEHRIAIDARCNTYSITDPPVEFLKVASLDNKGMAWSDFIFTMTDDANLQWPVILQIIGTILRLNDGDAFVFGTTWLCPALIRRDGVVFVENVQWHWTKEEVDPISIPYIFAELPFNPAVNNTMNMHGL